MIPSTGGEAEKALAQERWKGKKLHNSPVLEIFRGVKRVY